MAQKTFLEIVNKVLKKLREDTVTSVDSNDYSSLVGEFVNDAKKEVENAWDWSAMLTIYPVVSTGTYVYTLTGSTDESRLAYDADNQPMVYDTTTGEEFQLSEIEMDEGTFLINVSPTTFATNNKPARFSILNSGTHLVAQFDGDPYVGRTYKFYCYTPQDELDDDTDVLTIPWRPVYHQAVVYALEERGEEIGEPGSGAVARATTSLADAIALDSRFNPRKSMFTVT
jgi:hypothetical protein